MNKIVPAILASDRESFRSAVQKLSPFCNMLHVDLADGRFVPNTTLSLADLRAVEPAKPYRIHLMYDRPECVLRELTSLRAECIIIHPESTHNLRAVTEEMRELGKHVGVAVNPETPLSAIEGIAAELTFVLFLAVRPGFQGGTFQAEVVKKIADFQQRCPRVKIGIDGGINRETIQRVKSLHLDTIVVGSAIIGQENPESAYRELQQLAA